MNQPRFTQTRCLAALWLLAILVTTALCLIPAEQIPSAVSFWDKAQHALAFAALAGLGLWAWPQRWGWVMGLLAAHGGLIEVLQAKFTTTRQGEWGDWLADVLGVALAALVAWALAWWRRRGR